MSPGSRGPPPVRFSSTTDRLWRPRTFNTNYVCATEDYSARAFAACCDGPVTNSVVPIEAKAAIVSPGGVCAAYCYVDETRMASSQRNPHACSDYYICLVEMGGENGLSGPKNVHGEWVAINGEQDATEGKDTRPMHRDHRHNNNKLHQSSIPVVVPFDLDSDTGELIFPSPFAAVAAAAAADDDEDELRKRSTTDETLAPDADSTSNNKHKTEDPADIKEDPKLANPDAGAQNNNQQAIASDRPLPSTPLANSTTTAAATPTIETGFTTVPGPTGGVGNNTSTLPTQTGTETEAPNAGQPTSTSAAAAAAGRLEQRKGVWGPAKWACLVAVLVGEWAAIW